MKATLSFDLPEESAEHRCALDGAAWRYAMEDLDNWLRNQIKYNSETWTEEGRDALQKARDYLHETLRDNNLGLMDA